MQLDYQRARTEESIVGRAADLVIMREVLVALLEIAPFEKVDAEVEQTFEVVSDLRPDLPLPVYTGPKATYPQNWPNVEDVRRVEAAVDYRGKLLVRIDLAACVFGCAIARWIAAHGEPSDPALHAKVRDAIARHRIHRMQERKERIAFLEKVLETSENAGAFEAILARLRALDEATLLQDRLVIHRT